MIPIALKKYGLRQKMTLKISNLKGIPNGMQGNQTFVHFYLKEKLQRIAERPGASVAFPYPGKIYFDRDC
jgi:hypothetical protein